MTTTAIYCRVSGPGQRNTTSLPEQERLCREHAATLGWPVSEQHVYHEVMGGEDLYRPQMDRLWESIIRHEIDAVVIDVLDRLSRDEGDVGAFFHHCDRYGVHIEIASEDIDESESGRNMRTLAGMMARMERADIRRRTQRGRRARTALGKLFTTSYPLYGYLFADEDTKAAYVVDPETAPIVQRIYAAVAEGIPIRTLAKQLEAEGIPTPGMVLASRGQLPKGKPVSAYWRHGSITRILHTPAYVGRHSINRWQTESIKTRPAETGITRKVRNQHERAFDDPARVFVPLSVCPALVSEELGARAAARMVITKNASAGRNPDPLATLWRGMSRCGHCGGPLHTGKTSAGGRRYRCDNIQVDGETGHRKRCPGGVVTMTATNLDPVGWGDVVEWLSNEKNMARLLKDWQDTRAQGERSIASRLNAADAQLATLRAKMNALTEAVSEQGNREARQALQEKLSQVGEQLTREQVKRERLLSEAVDASAYVEASHDVAAWARLVAKSAASFTEEEKRECLRALGAEVEVWRADYVHPDGWGQRYKITLNFVGFSGGGQATILPQGSQRKTAQPAIVTRAS
jgi:DNA invertase Pin-like site-specific DNA recombinase